MKKKKNPYEGPQAEGYDAFFAGIPRYPNPKGSMGGRGKARRWDMGWIKAKLASEQGKVAL